MSIPNMTNAVTLVVPQTIESTLVNSISDESVREMMVFLDKVVVDTKLTDMILKIKAQVEFQGFDVKTTLRALSAVFSTKYAKNQEVFTEDLIFLLVLFISRGVVTQKTMNRMGKEASEKYNGVATKFGIQVSQKALAPHVLTLPRISQANPILSTRISIVVGGKDYIGPFKSHNFPAVIKNSAFAALIPQGNLKVKTVLAAIFTCYTTDQAWALTTKKPKAAELKEMYSNQLKFTEMAISGSLIEEKRRVACMLKFNVGDFLKYVPGYLTAVSEAVSVDPPEFITVSDVKKMFGEIKVALKDSEENPMTAAFGVTKKGKKPVDEDDDEDQDEEEEKVEVAKGKSGKKGKGKQKETSSDAGPS